MKHTFLMTGLTMAILAGLAGQGYAAGGHNGPRHSFEELDINGDGQITRAEMESHKQARFEQSDSDGDGKLSRAELETRIQKKQKLRREHRLDKMIKRHDTNGDGALTFAEMSENRRHDHFTTADANEDGAISASEFAAMKEAFKGHKGKWKHDNGGAED